MADFCKQCSIELFGEDYEDLANLIQDSEVCCEYYVSVICEGCGNTIVDSTGTCVSIDCQKHSCNIADKSV